ncbi:MAG: hypothetical protein R2849_02540 [Thermomicrobiales bacterium]
MGRSHRSEFEAHRALPAGRRRAQPARQGYTELGRFRSAYESYELALEADPANIIARRNLERLEPLRETEDDGGADHAHPPARYGAFIQEAGKTYVDDLVNPAPSSQLRFVAAGDKLEIARDGDTVVFVDPNGEYVGAPEPRLGRRLAMLIERGNTYEVFVTANAGDHVRVIVRELTRSDEVGDEMSFPEQVNKAIPRAYVRDSRLFRADEHDLIIPPDDDEDLEDLLGEDDEEEDTDDDTEIDTTFEEDEESDIETDDDEPIDDEEE